MATIITFVLIFLKKTANNEITRQECNNLLHYAQKVVMLLVVVTLFAATRPMSKKHVMFWSRRNKQFRT